MSGLSLTKTVRQEVAMLVEVGCEIKGSVKEGHLIVTEDGVKVYQALQKGAGGPWLVRRFNAGRISWTSSSSV